MEQNVSHPDPLRTATSSLGPLPFRSDIEGLRGIAVLVTVLFTFLAVGGKRHFYIVWPQLSRPLASTIDRLV